MKYTEREVLQFIDENDVKFVKLMFCDIFGGLRTISILSSELKTVFRNGLNFDASMLGAFMEISATDLLLYPDSDTMALLPWRPQQGRVVRFFCSIKYPDGTDFEGDGRGYLRKAIEYAKSKGYNFQIGTACEFYVFEKNEHDQPVKIPHDMAGYCDAAPVDKGENLRRDICLTLEQMDIYPQSSRHECGPGQNEIDFQYSNALKAADNLVTFKNVVKSMAERNGLYATFMPKPLADECGSGLHLMLFCMKGTTNVFEPRLDELPKEASNMLAGLLKHIKEMTLFLNCTTNSYKRMGTMLAPSYITWSHKNFAQLLRVPMTKQTENGVILRSPDNTCNPYFALGLVIYACLDGVLNEYTLQEPYNKNTRFSSDEELAALDKLPTTLDEALDYAENSKFIEKYLPKKMLNYFIAEKKAAAKEYEQAGDKQLFETQKYFYKL